MRLPPLFMDQKNRNAAWKAAGKPGKRNTTRNQILHPQYVEDYPDQEVKDNNGFGNTLYKTPFAVLYSWTEPRQ